MRDDEDEPVYSNSGEAYEADLDAITEVDDEIIEVDEQAA
jgi:hypothetical protein